MYSMDDLMNNDDIGDDLSIHSENEHEAHQENLREIENVSGEEVKKDEEDDKEKPAKKVRKKSNRPLLNAERLKGPRGLICMEKIFSKLKFRGKGHEREDLDTVMTALHHWSHRLYPKYTFDDTLAQIEKLGTKKPVITLKKKILMNMLDEETEVKDDEELLRMDSPPPAIDPFDLIKPVIQRQPSPEIEITDEMKEMMERNRLLAAERRKARLEAQKQEKENTENTSHQMVITVDVHHDVNEEIEEGNDTVPLLNQEKPTLETIDDITEISAPTDDIVISDTVPLINSDNIIEVSTLTNGKNVVSETVPLLNQNKPNLEYNCSNKISTDEIAKKSEEQASDTIDNILDLIDQNNSKPNSPMSE